jgi:serine phosphatase RsbU (regulator of sigma subunit)
MAALLLRRDDTLERLGSTCTVLGLFKEWDCSMAERQLCPGGMLVLYTDGSQNRSTMQGKNSENSA